MSDPTSAQEEAAADAMLDAQIDEYEQRMRDEAWVAVRFQPGDYGEWESVNQITGPFQSETAAWEWANTENQGSMYPAAEASPYWNVYLMAAVS